MRRIVFALMSTITAVVLLFTYHTSRNDSAFASPGTVQSSGVSPTATPSATPTATPSATSSAAPSATAAASAAVTYTGDSVNTRWGPVQVAITVQDGKITKSEAVVYPQENGRDREINAYALPVLDQAAVQSQSASIDAVSGATVTSDGYIQSLQSAIDQAHL